MEFKDFPLKKQYMYEMFLWYDDDYEEEHDKFLVPFSQYKILSMAMVNQFVLSYIGTWKPVCFIPAKLPCKVWYKVFIYHKIKSFCMYKFKWDTIVKFTIPNK